jgi:hypothetical protein
MPVAMSHSDPTMYVMGVNFSASLPFDELRRCSSQQGARHASVSRGRPSLLLYATPVRQRVLLVAAMSLLLAAALGLTPSVAGALSDTETVNTTADVGLGLTENPNACSDEEPGGKECPLRAALESLANLTSVAADDMVVVVPAGHYLLTKGTLTIGQTHANSCPPVKCPVTLRGAGAGRTVIDGQNATRLLTTLPATGPVTVEGVTLTHGASSASGGAISAANPASLTVRESALNEDDAADAGGAIFASAPLTVVDSSITANRAAEGAGVEIEGAPLTLLRSTVSGNKAGVEGGGLDLLREIEKGDNPVAATVTDSTVVGNSAGEAGGGIYVFGVNTIALRYSTVAGNTATDGGGVATNRPAAAMTIEGAILSGDSPNECSGFAGVGTAAANIVFGPSPCPFSGPVPLGGDPKLGALSANGGLGATLPLLRGSAAVNADGSSCPTTDAGTGPVDQRNVARPRGAACDLGAFESAADVGVTLAATPDPVSVGSSLSLTATVADSGSELLNGVTLTVPVPAGASFVSAPAGCNAAFSGTTTVTCQLGSIVPGQSVAISIAVRPERTGALSETASVIADQADYNPANDTATIASVAAAAPAQGAPATGTPGPAGSTGAAGSTLIGRSFTVDAHGNVTVRVSCPASANGGCRDALAIYSSSGVLPAAVARAGHKPTKATLLTSAHATIKAGRTASVRLRLNKAGRSLARAHKSFHVRLLLSAHDASSKITSHSYAVTLKRASKHRR